MKTVVHNNKVYTITDSDLQCLVSYKGKLDKLPESQRKDSIEEYMYTSAMREIFSSSEFVKIDKIF